MAPGWLDPAACACSSEKRRGVCGAQWNAVGGTDECSISASQLPFERSNSRHDCMHTRTGRIVQSERIPSHPWMSGGRQIGRWNQQQQQQASALVRRSREALQAFSPHHHCTPRLANGCISIAAEGRTDCCLMTLRGCELQTPFAAVCFCALLLLQLLTRLLLLFDACSPLPFAFRALRTTLANESEPFASESSPPLGAHIAPSIPHPLASQ